MESWIANGALIVVLISTLWKIPTKPKLPIPLRASLNQSRKRNKTQGAETLTRMIA